MIKQKQSHKTFYIVLGWTSVSLGMLGLVLPVLPTTPFLLLAAWCFAKSSQRYYKWIMYHPKLGKYLRDYKANRGIPFTIKLKVLVLLWLTMSVCIFAIIENYHIKLLLLGIAIAVTTHILTIKTHRKHKTKILILVPTANELKDFPKHKNVAVELCGVGGIKAAINTTEFINKYAPEWVILCGWAGAYSNSGLKIGQCVSVSSEAEADLGTIRNGEFIHLANCDFVDKESYMPQECPFCKEAGLTLASSNTVNKCCNETHNAMIENMEGAGFFQACIKCGVNFMEIRVISNIVGDAINPTVTQNLSNTITKLIDKLCTK